MKSEDYVLVAAIDFGTTFSGYAYSYGNAINDIKMNKNWGNSQGFESYKTPTSILTKGPNFDFVAFGYQAEEKYAELDEKKEDYSEYNLFRKFKMLLYQKGIISLLTKITSTTNREALAIDIFSKSLKFLMEHLLKNLTTELTAAPRRELIRWVITVPAIWRESSKKFMRHAAYHAGMIREVDSRQLVIALEPEAASFYCRQLDISKFERKLLLPSGSRFMVLDCGGGTNDMVVHEVVVDSKVKEIHAVNGGPWGAAAVDRAFESLLSDVIGAQAINKMKEQHPSQWLEFMARFEKAKKAIRLGDETRLTVQLPFLLAIELMGEGSRKRKKKNEGVTYMHGNLTLESKKIHEIFSHVLSKILESVNDVLQKAPKLGHIFLVGGFSNCALLRDVLQDYCSSLNYDCKLMIPHEAELAIIKGAVLYGHYSGQLISRVARKTYGYVASDRFDEKQHSDSHRYVDEDGQVLCGDLFHRFIVKGESVTTEAKRFVPLRLSSDQKRAIIPIYQSDCSEDRVLYSDDPELRKLGDVIIETPIPESYTREQAAQRQMVFTFYFGTTEILCEVHDETSGNNVKNVLDFLADIRF